MLTVSGTGPTERDAVAITRVGTSSLVRYIRRLGDTGPEERRLLGELTEARQEVARLQEETVVAEPNPELDAAQLREGPWSPSTWRAPGTRARLR